MFWGATPRISSAIRENYELLFVLHGAYDMVYDYIIVIMIDMNIYIYIYILTSIYDMGRNEFQLAKLFGSWVKGPQCMSLHHFHPWM